MRKPRLNRIAAGLTALLISGPALAFQSDMSAILRPDDRARLDQLDEVTGITLRRALSEATSEERDILVEGLSGQALPVGEASSVLTGEWSCRMLKLGRDLAFDRLSALPLFGGSRRHVSEADGIAAQSWADRDAGWATNLSGHGIYRGRHASRISGLARNGRSCGHPSGRA